MVNAMVPRGHTFQATFNSDLNVCVHVVPRGTTHSKARIKIILNVFVQRNGKDLRWLQTVNRRCLEY